MLRKVKVQTFLERERAPGLERLRMDADEALYLISCDARADIRELFDEDGQLLPIHRWPESIALSVKTFQAGRHGARIVLNDKLAALKIILQQTGTLGSRRANEVDALAEAIRSDIERHTT